MRQATPIPEGAVAQLAQALKEAKTKAAFQRVQCVWLRAALGLSAEQVATAIGWVPTSVRRLQARYLREGGAALIGLKRGGRLHQNLSEADERRVLRGFLDQAAQGGMLEVSRIKTAYEAAVGHRVPKSTVYRLLARHGWRKIAPRRQHPKADPARQPAFKKTASERASRG